ncbi:hypothetical protein Taro_019958 [Colocasia esculenta]|uniref:Nitrate regulatory gene2 protein n=1 Tax=Colocasia esculenta TaxID=4460 RepID=A0A843V3Q3_COLES|nr:hypothetical protein [Colocasia esculenta]
MGCAQSKIENEEAVSRCKERKQFMKEAVGFRNAFAAAHSAYAVSLKNTGAALSDYAQAEAQDVLHPSSAAPGGGPASSSAPSPAIKPPTESFPPPPPLPPEFSPSQLQRSASMPDMPVVKPRRRRSINDQPSPAEDSIREEDGDELEDDPRGDTATAESASPAPPPRPPPRPQPEPESEPEPSPVPPPPPNKPSTWDYFFGMDDNMHGASLGGAEEIRPEKEAREEEEAEKYKRAASSPSTSAAVEPDVPGVDVTTPPVTPEKVVVEPPMPPPNKQVKKQKGSAHHQYAASMGSMDARKGKMVPSTAPSVSLLQVLTDLDEHFLKASESAQDVSKMLEANRLHYHSNFADNRGHINHSERVMRAITWNKSFKGIPNADDGKDDFDADEWETHATILDKLLAWEKKLYDEVKASELMKLEYQRKVAQLNKQKKRGASAETLEKTKAAVSHLHTRYIVDMQSMDSTVSEIERLRDDRLYPKLTALVDGMAKMWEMMCLHHKAQLDVVVGIRSIDVSNAPKETSEHHYDRTVQLWKIVNEWHTQFKNLVTNQKDYIKALNNWLKLNLIPIESSLKEKVSSPPRVHHPPIQSLLLAWHEQLEKLPDDHARSAIYSFAAVVNAIMIQLQDELKQKEKCEETQKEYIRKKQAFEEWYHKYQSRRAPQPEEADADTTGTVNNDPVAERELQVDVLKKKLEDEVETHQRLCRQSREKSVHSLKTHLPELFRAMSEFTQQCSEMYTFLRDIPHMQNGAAS